MIMQKKIIGIIVSVLLAAAGTGLLVAYVRSAESRAQKGERTVSVLVASATIPKGTKATDLSGKVRTEQVPAKVVARGAMSTVDPIADRVASIDLLPGDQLVESRFAPAAEVAKVVVPPGSLEVTVGLDAVRAIGGQVREGDSVAVVASFDDPQTTHVILQKVPVTGVRDEQGAPVGSPAAGTSPTGKLLVTLALDPPSVERVVFAAEFGRLWLSWEPKEASGAGTKVQTRAEVYK